MTDHLEQIHDDGPEDWRDHARSGGICRTWIGTDKARRGTE